MDIFAGLIFFHSARYKNMENNLRLGKFKMKVEQKEKEKAHENPIAFSFLPVFIIIIGAIRNALEED